MRIVSKLGPVATLITIFLFSLTNFALIAFFGGNFSFAFSLVPLAAALICLGGLAFPSRLVGHPQSNLLLALVFAPVALTLAYAGLQAVHIPSLAFLAHPVWQVLTTAPHAAISLSPTLTLAHLSYACGLLVLALAVLRIAQSRPALLVGILAALVTAAAFYGIIIFAQGNNWVLWLPKTSYLDALSATFINRNSFATLAGLGILANLALALHRVGEISSRLSPSQRLRAFWLLVLKPGWPWLALAVVCFLALVLTQSRAGFVATLAGTAVLLGSLCLARPPARIPLLAIIGTLGLASIFVLASVGGSLGARLNNAQADVTARQSIFALSREIISQYPLTGTGLGTYQQAYNMAAQPEYLSEVNGTVEHAHNTYYELAVELGLPAMALLALAVITAAYILVFGLQTRRRAVVWPALGLATMVLVGSHALADFSLSIPAVAIMAITLITVGLAQSLSARKDSPETTPSKTTPILLAILAVALLLVSSWQSLANFHEFRAQPTLTAISTVAKNTTVPDILRARKHLETCLALNPWHPTCGFGLAYTNLMLARTFGLSQNSDNRGLALVYLNMSRNQYTESLGLAPGSSRGWYRLATLEDYLGNRPAAIAALTNSLLVGPAEVTIAASRMPLMLTYLPELSDDDKRLYTDLALRTWRGSVWSVAPVLRANPSTLPVMAEIIKNDPPSIERWRTNIGTPLPEATPVAPAPETR